MSRLAAIWRRILEHRSRERFDRDFRDELNAHAEALRDEYLARGLSFEEAHRAAMLDIGGLEQQRELVNARRGFVALDHLGRDIRYAFRMLARAPGFAIVAVLTLALGIGANAAIFSFVDAVILRPLPYPDPDRLIALWEYSGRQPRDHVAPANAVDYRRVHALEDLALYMTASVSLTGDGPPEGHVAEQVTPNYFSVLRTQPALGRTFTPEEDSEHGRKAAIISDALWKNRFGGAEDILGRAITLNGVPHEIVGVMPPGFQGVSQFGFRDARQIWLPAATPADMLHSRGEHIARAVGRLRDGATVTTAQTELTAIADGLRASDPSYGKNMSAHLQPLANEIVRGVRRSLVALMLTVGLILTIACVNVANLLIARGVGRRREIAVRFALGATRARVHTALITESVVIALLGSAAGLLLAVWMQRLLVGVAPTTMPRLADVAIDGRVIAFTIIVSLLVGVVFGTLPAWQAGQSRPIDAMSSGGRVVAGRRVMRWRSALMIGQLAISALLLVGAGLMIRSLMTLNGVELGFDTAPVMTARTNLPPAKYPTPEARLAFFSQLEERLLATPGVATAGFANTFPMRGGWSSGFQIDGLAPPPQGYYEADFQAVSPRYFSTLGIPLLRGRSIERSDTNTAMAVAVVSEAFERKLLGGTNALGRRLARGGPTGKPITIVGVVRDVRRDGRTADIAPQVYLPAAQTGIYPVRLSEIAARSADDDPTDLAAAIRTAVWSIDPDQPITNIRTLDEILLSESADRRFQTWLFSIFAVLALVLASIGTYGVVAYLVSQRTSEIGVRLALGASRARIYRWLIGRTAMLLVAGTALGIAVARWLARFMQSLLFGVTPTDPATYAAAAGALFTVAMTACVLAVRRASRVEPTVALRYE